jgi:hypothetical protein
MARASKGPQKYGDSGSVKIDAPRVTLGRGHAKRGPNQPDGRVLVLSLNCPMKTCLISFCGAVRLSELFGIRWQTSLASFVVSMGCCKRMPAKGVLMNSR